MAARLEFLTQTNSTETNQLYEPTLLEGKYQLLRLPTTLITDGRIAGNQAFIEVVGDQTRVGIFEPNETDPKKISLRLQTFDSTTLDPQPIDIPIRLDSGRQPQIVTARITHVK